MSLSAQQILAGKPADIFRQYIPHVEFVASNGAFFQKIPSQIRALPGYPNLLSVSVNRDLPFRTIWGYIMSDLSQVVTMNDCDLVALLDGLVVYRQKLWMLATSSATFWSGFTTLAANQSVQNEVLFVNLALGEFFFHPIRLNLNADTFYIQVNTLKDAGSALYDGQLFVRSMAGI